MASASLPLVQGGSKAVIPVSCEDLGHSVASAVQGVSVEVAASIVSDEIQKMPNCSCEVIKGAIKGSEGSRETVAVLVDAAIQGAPDHIDEIVSCAIAAAPDAMNEILAVAAKYGWTPNPLDFPGSVGDPADEYLFLPNGPVFVNPPLVSVVDP